MQFGVATFSSEGVSSVISIYISLQNQKPFRCKRKSVPCLHYIQLMPLKKCRSRPPVWCIWARLYLIQCITCHLILRQWPKIHSNQSDLPYKFGPMPVHRGRLRFNVVSLDFTKGQIYGFLIPFPTFLLKSMKILN